MSHPNPESSLRDGSEAEQVSSPLLKKHKATLLGYKEDINASRGEIASFSESIPSVTFDTLSSFCPRESMSTNSEEIADALIASGLVHPDDRDFWIKSGKAKGGQFIRDHSVTDGDKTIRVQNLVMLDRTVPCGVVEIEKAGSDKQNVVKLEFGIHGYTVSYNDEVLGNSADFPLSQFDKTLTLKLIDVFLSYPEAVMKETSKSETRRKLDALKKEDSRVKKVKASGIDAF